MLTSFLGQVEAKESKRILIEGRRAITTLKEIYKLQEFIDNESKKYFLGTR
ncbi:MAG: hypothetical protein ACXWE6_11475 [Nitrososphaeraceae archaeon]